MAPKNIRSHHGFKQLEQKLTYVVFGDLALFLFTLLSGGKGLFWLKVILGILTIGVSAAGCAFLVLIQEHRKSRSWWILSAFGSMLVCTIVSFLTNYPRP